jgi:hypothetical protein
MMGSLLTSCTCGLTIGPLPIHPIRHKIRHHLPLTFAPLSNPPRALSPSYQWPTISTSATTAALAAQSPLQLTFPIRPAPRPLLANQTAHASSRAATPSSGRLRVSSRDSDDGCCSCYHRQFAGTGRMQTPGTGQACGLACAADLVAGQEGGK